MKIFTTDFTTNHYHNRGVNIYYYTNFCSNPTMFQFYHKPLQLSSPNNVFCTSEKNRKEVCKDFEGVAIFGKNLAGTVVALTI